MTFNNKGFQIEDYMRSWFKGQDHCSDAVDFQTKTYLYEVKSCRMFNKRKNVNHQRKFAKKQHKQCEGFSQGRFFIINENHKELKELADKQNKIPKYVFVIQYKGQKIWKVVPWNKVEIQEDRVYTQMPLTKIFYNGLN